ncbi:hypothetical protein CA54_55510 [Symmachiella macrocystis]|uniref:Uncharacterized protein n=1 Tax=Symmachiella macrocystis TaxID=2527985 RepID=A0A5C6B775_9PLAN|nr:hypothetical protein CA54_55510 [Symmachiella macrocystis]
MSRQLPSNIYSKRRGTHCKWIATEDAQIFQFAQPAQNGCGPLTGLNLALQRPKTGRNPHFAPPQDKLSERQDHDSDDT